MRHFRSLLLCLIVVCSASSAYAQDPPPPIGPYVVDLRMTVPRFPDDEALAQSRGLTLAELPGSGLGLDLNAHVYALTWKTVTFGLGAQVTLGRAHVSPQDAVGTPSGRAVTERFTHIAPQLSLNFGTGDGWSYLSGGIGPSVWSITPEGNPSTAADEERLRTINYGGGARWFTKRHVAFHFDVRFYDISPGVPTALSPGTPRTRLLILGAGVSLR